MKRIDIDNLIIDADMKDSEDSFYNADEALEEGFDRERPIVIDENGFIIDGNHRYLRFKEENRLAEISVIAIIGWNANRALDAFSANIENCCDDKYYPFVKKIGKWIQKPGHKPDCKIQSEQEEDI